MGAPYVRWNLSLAAAVAAILIANFSPPAHATKLPSDLLDLISAEFPGAKVRLDGAVEASGALFLPLIPHQEPAGKKRPKLQLVSAHPNPEHPDVLVYNNGWSFLRVRKKGNARTVILPAELPDKLRKQLLACKFPSDLIVPDAFVLPQSLKALVGDTAVQTASDATIGSPEFGLAADPNGSPQAAGPGSYFVTSLTSGTITLVDGQTLAKTADFPTEGTPCSMCWAGGRLYITDQAKNRVLILDAVKRQFLGQIDLPAHSAPKGIVALPNGRLIYVAETGSNDIAVIETATNKVLLRTKVAPGPGRLAVTPNGNFLIVLNVPSGQMSFLSTLNQSLLGAVKVGDVPTGVALTKDSTTAFVSNRGSNSISVVDIGARKVTGTIAAGSGPTGLALSSDNTRLYVANAKENTIGVYDTKSHEKVTEARLPLDVDFPYALDLMPDGKRLLISSESTETIASLDVSKMEFDKQSAIGHTSHDLIWVPVR
jgi:YVTN family beta-propeller protein